MREPQEQKKQRLQAVMEELCEKNPAKPLEEEMTLINKELDLSEAYQKMKSGENNSDSEIKTKKPEPNQESQDPRVLEEPLDLPPLKDAGTGLWNSLPYAMNGKICSRKEQDNSIETEMKSFNYEPLWATMKALGIDFGDLKKQAKLGSHTVDKLINGERVMISVIAKICLVLGCDLSDVVGLNYEWDIEKDNRDI